MTTSAAADACLFIAMGLIGAWLFYLVVTGIAYAMQIKAQIEDKEDRS